jgi:Co/Zn/Cd efflux system component
LTGVVPEPVTMGVVGALALAANVGVAVLLFAHRQGDSNRRSVWLCTRNDAISNLAVLVAALGVFGTGTGWPDVIVAGIMAVLALHSGWQVVRLSLSELRGGAVKTAPAE